MNRIQKSMAAVSALALGACGSISGQSPEQMVRTGIERQFKQDSSYRFTSEFILKPAVDTQAAQRPSEKAGQECDEVHLQTCMLEKIYGSNLQKKSTVKLDVMTKVLTHFSLRYQGTVDLGSGRIEAVPELRYETRNASASVRFPMQLNLKTQTLLLDPNAVAPAVDYFIGAADFAAFHAKRAEASMKNSAAAEAEQMPSESGKAVSEPVLLGDSIIKIQASESVRTALKHKLPLKSIIAALPKAVSALYMQPDPSAYRQLEMDEAGRKIKAKYRIRLTATAAESFKNMDVALVVFRDEITRQTPDADEAESHRRLLAVLDKAVEDSRRAGEEMTQVLEKTAEQNGQSQNETDRYLKKPQSTEFYLDRKGRLLAMKSEWNSFDLWTLQILAGSLPLNGYWWTQLDYGKPEFVLNPDAANVVPLAKISPTAAEKLDKALLELADKTLAEPPADIPKQSNGLEQADGK